MHDPLYAILRPVLFCLDAERAHDRVLSRAEKIAHKPLLLDLVRRLLALAPQPALAQNLLGLDFPSPIGLAAGLDKDGVAIDFWAALGFGFVEVGTVTPGRGQPGNEKPRLARLVRDRALVNRMGFNNRGADALCERLMARRTRIPVGANLGKAKGTPLEHAAEDYVCGLKAVFRHVDYVAINVSSPNTPGLRDLQWVDALGPLLRRLVDENQRLARTEMTHERPLLLKVSPDLTDEGTEQVARTVLDSGFGGIIATNTTMRTDGLRQEPPFLGGISGRPLAARAKDVVRIVRRAVGDALVVVGTGGISTSADVLARMQAGANLVQIYTGFVYGGPRTPGRLAHGLMALMRQNGYSNVSEMVGCSSTQHNVN